MNFRTEIIVKPSVFRISHNTPLMLAGSCFTEYIGKKLQTLSFPLNINPCGIVFNPYSVFKSFEILIENKEFTESDLNYYNELWFSFDHHSSFSHPEKNECLRKINSNIKEGYEYLKKAEFIVITLGTSRVYKHKKLDRIISNCHKIPDTEFDQHLMTTSETVQILQKLIDSISGINQSIKYIFTISPVRHWKDGAVGNQISKAALILAVHKVIDQNPGRTEYFPAYELMLDDLRDYRFYADDLLHPDKMAVEYIWQKFSETYFDDITMHINKDLTSLSNALNHKPFIKETNAWKKFIAINKQKAEILAEKHPYLNLDVYMKYFR